MCFGYDGEGALRRSLEEKGASRRSLFRGAAAGAAGAAVARGGLAAPASAPRQVTAAGTAVEAVGAPRQDQHPALHAARRHGGPARLRHGAAPGSRSTATRRSSCAGYYGRTAQQIRDQLDDLGIRASSSHDGISADAGALHTKLENAVTLGQRYVVVPYLNSNSLSDWQHVGRADERRGRGREEVRAALRLPQPRPRVHDRPRRRADAVGGADLAARPGGWCTSRSTSTGPYTGGVNSGAARPGAVRDRRHPRGAAAGPPVPRQGPRRAPPATCVDLGTGVIDFPRIFRTHEVEEYIVENDTPDVTPAHLGRRGPPLPRPRRVLGGVPLTPEGGARQASWCSPAAPAPDRR